MKKYFIIFFVASLFIIRGTLDYKDTEWTDNSPAIVSINTNCVQFSFSVTEPATIYWRVYSDYVPTDPHELTNISALDRAVTYGGNITTGQGDVYTNIIDNLSPKQNYYLSAIAVSYIGNFPKKVINIPFRTL